MCEGEAGEETAAGGKGKRKGGGERKIQVDKHIGQEVQKGFEDHWEKRLNGNQISLNLICTFSEEISELLSKEAQASQKENKGFARRIKFEEEAGLGMETS